MPSRRSLRPDSQPSCQLSAGPQGVPKLPGCLRDAFFDLKVATVVGFLQNPRDSPYDRKAALLVNYLLVLREVLFHLKVATAVIYPQGPQNVPCDLKVTTSAEANGMPACMKLLVT